MAEERLIDDDRDKDKDRKYRFRINEDGEEELEIAEEPEDEQQDAEGGLDIPEFEEDDEEAVDKTPEQLAAERERAERERAAREGNALALLQKAKAAMAEGKQSYALTLLDSAVKECGDIGEAYSLRMEILSEGYTSAARAEDCVDALDGYSEHVPADERGEISKKFAPVVRAALEEQEKKNALLKAENDEKKKERRLFFASGYKRALTRFSIALIPLILFVTLGIGFGSVMYADEGGVYYVLAIAFFVAAGISLVVSVFFARLLAAAARKVRVNESDSSTALGRQYLEGKRKEEVLRQLYDGIYQAGTK